MGPFRDNFGTIIGTILGPFWNRFGNILVPFCDHFGTIFRLFWYYFGTILGPFWDHFGTILGLFWDHFGTILGQFWDHYGDYFGTILGPFLFWPLGTYFDLWGPILTLNWVCLLLHLLLLKRGPKAPRRAQRAPQPSAGARRMGA